MPLALICVFAFCGTASAQVMGDDPDGDGIPSVIDFCDNQAGTQEFFGCPSDDSDGDGIGISQGDQCPGEAGPAPEGCPPPPPVEPPPEAETVEARTMSLERSGNRVSLYGQPFLPSPVGLFTPRTLTVWLPKGISLLGRKVKPCSEAKVRNARGSDALNRCRFAAGRLSTPDELSGWEAYAGPTQGKGRLVWLRTVKNNRLIAFATGVVQKASGVYGTKLVLRYGELDLRTRLMEVGIGGLREEGKCPSGGWRQAEDRDRGRHRHRLLARRLKARRWRGRQAKRLTRPLASRRSPRPSRMSGGIHQGVSGFGSPVGFPRSVGSVA